MKAKEYFEEVRRIVIEVEQSQEMLEHMLSLEDVRAQRYELQLSSNGSDMCEVINTRLEFQQRLQARIADTADLIHEATVLLYGEDDHGGLAKSKGTRYADVLYMAYVDAMSWKEVADVMRCSVQWCREMSNIAFNYIDANGFARLKAN